MAMFKGKRGDWTKLCEDCGKPFIRDGKFQKKCNDCIFKAKSEIRLKVRGRKYLQHIDRSIKMSLNNENKSLNTKRYLD